jgi:hypothetical protein
MSKSTDTVILILALGIATLLCLGILFTTPGARQRDDREVRQRRRIIWWRRERRIDRLRLPRPRRRLRKRWPRDH